MDTWQSFLCPGCKKGLIFYCGDRSDITAVDATHVSCWSCGENLELPDESNGLVTICGRVSKSYCEDTYPIPRAEYAAAEKRKLDKKRKK